MTYPPDDLAVLLEYTEVPTYDTDRISSSDGEGSDAPTALETTSEAAGLRLSWVAPTEDVGSVTGYRIERGVANAGVQQYSTLVDDTETTDTTYVDNTAQDGVIYAYRVLAMRDGSASEPSNAVRISHRDFTVPFEESENGILPKPQSTEGVSVAVC